MMNIEFGFPKKSINENEEKVKRENIAHFPNGLTGEVKFRKQILHDVKLGRKILREGQRDDF